MTSTRQHPFLCVENTPHTSMHQRMDRTDRRRFNSISTCSSSNSGPLHVPAKGVLQPTKQHRLETAESNLQTTQQSKSTAETSVRSPREEGKRARERRCENVRMRRCEGVKMRRCEDLKIKRCENVKMRRCKMRRCEGVKVRRLKDVKMRRWEDVKMRRCKMRKYEDVKWEDVKMFEDVYTRPPLLEEPFAQTLSGKMILIYNDSLFPMNEGIVMYVDIQFHTKELI